MASGEERRFIGFTRFPVRAYPFHANLKVAAMLPQKRSRISGLQLIVLFLCVSICCRGWSKTRNELAALSVSVQAEAVQPADYPVIITLKLAVIGSTPFTYWCGGPGKYPSVDIFPVTLTDNKGQERKILLANGQYIMGSGMNREIKPGETMDVPASLGLLMVGSYSIQVGDGKAVKVEVKEDLQLAQQRKQEVVSEIHQGNPFQQFVTKQYDLDPVIEILQDDLTGTDVVAAENAAYTLYLIHPKPANLATTITKTMDQQLPQITKLIKQQFRSTAIEFKRFQLLSMLVQMAGEIGSDDALVPVMTVLDTDTSEIPDDAFTPCNPNLESVKITAVKELGRFKQQRATDELHRLLRDNHFWVPTTAAQILAKRKDSAGRAILRAHLFDRKTLNRSNAYDALLNFPDDPEYKLLIEYGLSDTDESIRQAAKAAQAKRE